jgi:LysR family hydrogen peroxide-inducible transcriptional activator
MRPGPFPFTLRQLQYAVAVGETLNFRRAAERCHVSPPSLSAQLAELEGAVGVRLFERDRKRVLVTAAGQELVARARSLLVNAEDLLGTARRLGDPLLGTFRVGIIPTISPYLLPAVAPALRARYPALTILWVEDKTDALVRSLAAGNLDAAVVALESRLGDVEHEVIARDPFVLAIPIGHPLGRSKAPATRADLRGARVLLLDDGQCFRDQALALCAAAEAQELDFRATSLSTLAQMVAGGAGVTLLPRLAVATEARRSRLAVRPFAEPAPARTLALAWRRSASLGPALRQIAATIRERHAQAHPARRGTEGNPRKLRIKRAAGARNAISLRK